MLVELATLAALLPANVTPVSDVEEASIRHGVDYHLALAVQWIESKNTDTAKSQGNYGSFQINCTVWKKFLKLDHCDQLFERQLNVDAGVMIIARYQKRYAPRSGKHHCRVHGKAHAWISHYKDGGKVTQAGVTYGKSVLGKMYQLKRKDTRKSQGKKQS